MMILACAYGDDPDFSKPPIRNKIEVARLTGVSFCYISNVFDGRYSIPDIEKRFKEYKPRIVPHHTAPL